MIKKYILGFAVLVLGIFIFAGVASASTADNVYGWAWADNVGWISFNCTDFSLCTKSNYGVSIDATSGNLSGYAWSDNIGWISFNESELSGCPTGACKAKLAGNSLTGWAKALSADNHGWDGWISLNGSSPDYGVTKNGTDFENYAWGSDVVGWINFNPIGGGVHTGVPVVTVNISNTCSSVTYIGDTSCVADYVAVGSCVLTNPDGTTTIINAPLTGQSGTAPIPTTELGDKLFSLNCDGSALEETVVSVISSPTADYTLSANPHSTTINYMGGGINSGVITITGNPTHGFNHTVPISVVSIVKSSSGSPSILTLSLIHI